MKRIVCFAMLCALTVCGCARHYVLTLSNGSRITTTSKPKLENGAYVFKDAAGKPAYVPAGRVREVAPASMVTDDTAQFKSFQKKAR